MSSAATNPLAPTAFELVRARLQSILSTLQTVALENGARLHLLPTGSHGIVAFEVWAAVGSGDEPKTFAGISHLLEHLMFRGTTELPDGEFDAIVEAKGIQANAWTWFDTTAYTAILPTEALPELMAMEADRLQNLDINEDIFQTERDVVLNERALTADSDPNTLAQEHLDRMLFGDGPYAHPVIGYRENIAAFTREQVTNWYRQHYAPSELDVFIIGDIHATDVLAVANETFGALPSPPHPREARPPAPPHHKGKVESIELAVAEPLVMMAWGLPPRADLKATATWKLMGELLTFGRGGFLRAELEYDQRLALEQQFYVNEHRLGHSALWEATPRDGIASEDLASAFYATLAKLADIGPTEAELDSARVRILSYLSARSAPWQVARMLGSALHDTGSIDSIVHDLDALQAVSADDIRALARQLSSPENSVLLYVSPE